MQSQHESELEAEQLDTRADLSKILSELRGLRAEVDMLRRSEGAD